MITTLFLATAKAQDCVGCTNNPNYRHNSSDGMECEYFTAVNESACTTTTFWFAQNCPASCAVLGHPCANEYYCHLWDGTEIDDSIPPHRSTWECYDDPVYASSECLASNVTVSTCFDSPTQTAVNCMGSCNALLTGNAKFMYNTNFTYAQCMAYKGSTTSTSTEPTTTTDATTTTTEAVTTTEASTTGASTTAKSTIGVTTAEITTVPATPGPDVPAFIKFGALYLSEAKALLAKLLIGGDDMKSVQKTMGASLLADLKSEMESVYGVDLPEKLDDILEPILTEKVADILDLVMYEKLNVGGPIHEKFGGILGDVKTDIETIFDGAVADKLVGGSFFDLLRNKPLHPTKDILSTRYPLFNRLGLLSKL